MACKDKPKVIQASNTITQEQIKDNTTTQANPSSASTNEDVHQVSVKEVLTTEKYAYLKVSEQDRDDYWIAVMKQEINKNEKYFYQGGLLKKNFYSQEFDRNFEEVFLVSKFWSERNLSQGAVENANKAQPATAPMVSNGNSIADSDIITIKYLIENKERLEGEWVYLKGECTKVNPNIMNRNWVHLKDGSADDIDLTITTQEQIPVGSKLTLKGKVALDRDFGAGYRYSILIEEAILP